MKAIKSIPMFKIVLVLCAVLMPLSQAAANPPSMIGYCVKPPFLATRTQPNVVVVFDNSGSMEGRPIAALLTLPSSQPAITTGTLIRQKIINIQIVLPTDGYRPRMI